MSNALTARQSFIASALAANSVLSAIPIVTEDRKDPLAEALVQIAKGALSPNPAGKSGIAIVILTIALGVAEQTMGPLAHVEITQRIWVRENTSINRDSAAGIGVTSLDAIVAIIQTLQGLEYSSGTPAAAPPKPHGGAGRGMTREALQFDSGQSQESPDLTTLDWFLDFTWHLKL